jgi:16S rRNA processing protein RimM
VDRKRVVVAELIRPRGNRGEVLGRSQTDVPGRLEGLRTAYARFSNGIDAPVTLEAVWPHRGEWVFKFAGVDSIDAAERFRGADLWVPEAERAALPAGQFFQSDLIGYRITAKSGDFVGLLVGWQEYGGPALMEVEMNDRRTVLIPFSRDFCEVKREERTVNVDVPEGLLDL